MKAVLDLILGEEVQFAYKRPLLLRATAREASEIENEFHALMKELSQEFFAMVTSEFGKQAAGSEALSVRVDRPEEILCLLLEHGLLDTANIGKVKPVDLPANGAQADSSKLLRATYELLMSRGSQTVAPGDVKTTLDFLKRLLAFVKNLPITDFFSKVIDPNMKKPVYMVFYPNVERAIDEDPWSDSALNELCRHWGAQIRNVVQYFGGCKNLKCMSLTECMNELDAKGKSEEIEAHWRLAKGERVFSFLMENPLLYSSFLVSFFRDASRFLGEAKELAQHAGQMRNTGESKGKYMDAVVNAGKSLETLLTILYFVSRKHAPKKEYALGEFLEDLKEEIESFGRETLTDLYFVKDVRNRCAHYRQYGDDSDVSELNDVMALMTISRVEMFLGIMKLHLKESILESHGAYLP